jgi:hypothetical protein
MSDTTSGNFQPVPTYCPTCGMHHEQTTAGCPRTYGASDEGLHRSDPRAKSSAALDGGSVTPPPVAPPVEGDTSEDIKLYPLAVAAAKAAGLDSAPEGDNPPPLEGEVWRWVERGGDWRCLTSTSHHVYYNGAWLLWRSKLTHQEQAFVATLVAERARVAELKQAISGRGGWSEVARGERTAQYKAKQRVEELERQVVALTALVESAFAEGHRLGWRAYWQVSDQYANQMTVDDWNLSCACKALLASAEGKATGDDNG